MISALYPRAYPRMRRTVPGASLCSVTLSSREKERMATCVRIDMLSPDLGQHRAVPPDQTEADSRCFPLSAGLLGAGRSAPSAQFGAGLDQQSVDEPIRPARIRGKFADARPVAVTPPHLVGEGFTFGADDPASLLESGHCGCAPLFGRGVSRRYHTPRFAFF